MKAVSPTQLDAYSLRSRRAKSLRRPESIFSSSPLANILLLAFILTDAVCFYSMWNVIISEEPLLLIMLALSIAMVVDIPMAIAGVVMAQARDGLRDRKEAKAIALGCLATFLLAFSLSLVLRIVTKDHTISISSSDSGLVDMMTAEKNSSEDSAIPLCAAIFLAAIPCCTSAASYLVSLAVSSCLSDRIKDLECERICIQAHITELQQALAERMDVDAEIGNLIDRENALYDEFNAELTAMVVGVKETARLLMMEKLGDPESISSITESAEAVRERAQHTAKTNRTCLARQKQLNNSNWDIA